MTRIAIVLEATLGGTRKHVTDLIEHLPADHFEITYVYATGRADQTFFHDLKRLEASGVCCIELPMTSQVYHPSNLLCISRLAGILKRRKITVLHLHGAIAGTIGRLAALFCNDIQRILYSPHGGALHKLDASLKGRFFQQIEKALISRRLHFVAVSTDEHEKIRNCFGVDESRVSLIYNGIRICKPSGESQALGEKVAAWKTTLGLEPGDFILLYPALFLEAKGHLNFFQAVKAMQPALLDRRVRILLAGDGPLKPSIQELVRQLPCSEQIHFLGFVQEIEPLFTLSDAILLPSTHEAFGYVLLEAMYHGKPIFATAVGGIRDIVETGINGWLYDPDQLQTLLEDLNRYAENRSGLAHAAGNSMAVLQKKFDVSKTTRQVAERYIQAKPAGSQTH